MLSTRTGDKNMKATFKGKNITYILECRDHSFYTGWTNDLDRRLKQHNAGEGARYTRSRRPVKLVYYEIHQTKEEAMKREYAIKRLTRAQKLALIREEAGETGEDGPMKGKARETGEDGPMKEKAVKPFGDPGRRGLAVLN